MLHASPARASHRAASGGIALLVRQTAERVLVRQTVERVLVRRTVLPAMPTRPDLGVRRPPPQRRASEPQRPLQLLLSGLAAMIVVGIVGLIVFVIVSDERRSRSAASAPVAAYAGLSSRAVDPVPLSSGEVFPRSQVRVGDAAYSVDWTHIDTDCATATTGKLGPMLDGYGCTQVVRARLIAPHGNYPVTAGVFNLSDRSGADQVSGQIRQLVESGTGSFASMTAGSEPASAPVDLPESQVGWQVKGHYLVYAVITRPDGQQVGRDDPYAGRITTELLDTYLSGVLNARTLDP